MCVVAHPDDECFAFGGALLLAADRGIETYVVCLTDGQAATNRGDSTSGEDLGRMRREEFQASCGVLGVTRYELMDYQDGQLEYADFSHLSGRLVERMRDFRPDVVITFGADGGLNTHPDHTMVASLTAAAFHWAGLEKRYPEVGGVHRAHRLFGLSTNFFLEDRPEPMPAPWSAVLDISGVLGRKQAAFREHTSQAPLIERTKKVFEEFGGAEYYTLLAAREPQRVAVVTDLFEGLAI